jgi:hypothetical protein
MIPFAIYGGMRIIRHIPWKGFLPVSWVLALPILAYAPFNMQRRLVDGIWIALIVLSLGSVTSSFSSQDQAAANTTSRLRSWFYGLSSIGFVAALILIVGGITTVLNPSPPLYRLADQVRAFNELARIAAPGEVVLSSSTTGNPLPGYAPVRVVIGIGTLTVAYEEVAAQVASFYQADTPDFRRQELMNNWGVDFIYWGPDERELGDWSPRHEVFLEKIITAGEHEIFRVLNDE